MVKKITGIHRNLGVCRQIYRDKNNGNLVQYLGDACLLHNRQLVVVAIRVADNKLLNIHAAAFQQYFVPASREEVLRHTLPTEQSVATRN